MKRRVDDSEDSKPNKKAKKEKKQTAKHAELLLQHMNVACTGAREGELLLGVRNTTQDAIMKGTRGFLELAHELQCLEL